MPRPPGFVHLRLHTEYSLLEGAVRLKALPDLVARAGMPAVAVTETNNMFSALEAATGLAAKGVQPIMGCQVAVMHDPWRPGEKPRRPAPVVLLAKDEAGYRNLMALNTCLYMARPDLPPQVTFAELQAHRDGLICLSGGPGRRRRAAGGVGPGGPGGAGPGPAAGDLRRPPLRRVAAPPRGRADRAVPRRAGLCPRPAAGGDQRRRLRRGVDARRARRVPVHRGGRLCRPGRAAPAADPAALPQDAGGDGRSLRRPARGAGEHRRGRAPAAPSPPMAAIRSCRASPTTRWRSCAARRRPGSTRGWR